MAKKAKEEIFEDAVNNTLTEEAAIFSTESLQDVENLTADVVEENWPNDELPYMEEADTQLEAENGDGMMEAVDQDELSVDTDLTSETEPITIDDVTDTHVADAPDEPAEQKPRRRSRAASNRVLTIDDDTHVQSAEEKEAYLWMELRNSMRSKRVLTGTMGGVERMSGGLSVAVVYYKEMRIVIPSTEMFIHIDEHGGSDQRELHNRYTQILTRMLGAEIDFVVSGLDRRSSSVVASRRVAMLRKQQHYFLTSNRGGGPLIQEGQIVEARIISVGEKNMRVEVFGVEATVLARDIAWEWVDDCANYHQIGEHVLVKIMRVTRDDENNLRIAVSVREAVSNPARDNIRKCVVQGKYIGKVTGVDTRAIYVRLNVGVNAIATAVHDRKTPCRKDDVSFVITRIDEEAGLAIGIITRVIKQYI